MKFGQTFGLLLIPVVVAGAAGCGRSSDSTGSVAASSSATQSASGDPTTDQTLGSPHRGGTMKVISFIEKCQPGLAEKILRHCRLWQDTPPRPPPVEYADFDMKAKGQAVDESRRTNSILFGTAADFKQEAFDTAMAMATM